MGRVELNAAVEMEVYIKVEAEVTVKVEGRVEFLTWTGPP